MMRRRILLFNVFINISLEYIISMLMKNHPDVRPVDINTATKFSTISNAYEFLSDPIK